MKTAFQLMTGIEPVFSTYINRKNHRFRKTVSYFVSYGRKNCIFLQSKLSLHYPTADKKTQELFLHRLSSSQACRSESLVLFQLFFCLECNHGFFSIRSKAAIDAVFIYAVPLQKHLQMFHLGSRIFKTKISLRWQCWKCA